MEIVITVVVVAWICNRCEKAFATSHCWSLSKIEKIWGWESPFTGMVVSYTNQNPCPIAKPSNFYMTFSTVAEVPEVEGS
jgi:hypothetical protein